MAAPTLSPIGVMASSAPRVKNIMPTMIMAAPIRKHSSMLVDTGAIEKHSTSTMPTMGITAFKASLSFSPKIFLTDKYSPPFLYVLILYKDFRSGTRTFCFYLSALFASFSDM